MLSGYWTNRAEAVTEQITGWVPTRSFPLHSIVSAGVLAIYLMVREGQGSLSLYHSSFVERAHHRV